MASDPITALPSAAALTGSDPIVTVQAGVTVQSDVDAMKAFMDASPIMQFKGQADASAIDEDAATGTSIFETGDVYRINVASAAPHAFSDISEDLLIGDWVVFNGTIFQKQDGTDPTAAETKTAYESNADTNAFTDAAQTKLGGIEALADVTDTANVDAAGAVMETDYNAQTVLLAVADNTPLPVIVGVSSFVGRKAVGDVGIMTDAEARTVLNVEDGAEVNTVNDVFGRTGNVVAAASDYAASQIDNDSNVAGDFVDDALNVLSNNSFEIQNAVLLAEEDISADNDEGVGIYFSLDGFKMYTCRFGNNNLPHVDEYTLSKPWDPSTKTKINTFDPTGPMSVTPRSSGVALSEDLTRLYVNEQLPSGEGKVHEWTLSIAGNISTTTFSTTLDMGPDISASSGRDITLGKNDTRLYVTLGDGNILQYNLSSAGLLSTALFSKSKDLSAQTSSASDFVFNTNGSKAFFSDISINRKLFQYTASVFWEIDSLTFDNIEFDPSVSVSQHASTFFRTHGSILFIIDGTDEEITSFAIRQGGDNQFLDDEKTKLSRLSADLLLNDQSSGILSGGKISINGGDNTKFDFTAGLLYIVDSFTDPDQPKITSVEFPAQTAIAATEVVTDNETFVGIRLDNVAPTGGTATAISATVNGSAGTVYITQKPSDEYTREETRDIVQIGALLHSGVVITQAFNLQQIVNNVALQLYDFAFAVGIINISGNEFSANGVNLNIDKTVGDIFRQGSNNDGSVSGLKNPNISTVPAVSPATFRYRFQDGSGDFIVGSDTTTIDPDQYDDGDGVLGAVGNNKWTIQKLYVGPNGELRIEYGQVIYSSESEAEAAISTVTITDPVLTAETAFRGWLIVKKGTTDLSNTSDAKFITAGKFNDVSPGVMVGEINTASNVGTAGIDVFKQKTGVNLEFNNINAESSKIAVTLNVGLNEIRIDAVPGNFNTGDLNNDAAFIANLVEDTTPQLGGNLDLNGNVITGLEIGTDVQAFDADTAKLDVAQEYTATQNFNATSLTALGADLVTNGAFAADTDWTKGTGWTIAAGVASSDGTQSADADLTQALSLVSGKTYEVEFTVSNYSAGNVTPVAGDVEGTDRAANGTFTENIVAGAGGDIDIRADLDFIGDIDDVTVRLANVSWDLAANQVTKITLDGDLVIDNPTNLVDGATYIMTLTQDGVGTRLVTWGSVFKWAGGTAPTLSTGVNDVDIITFVSDSTNMYGVFQGDFS